MTELAATNDLKPALDWLDLDGVAKTAWLAQLSHLNVRAQAAVLSAAWLGGDEFLIAVPHADAAPLAARVQALLQLVELSASRVIVAAAADLAATVGAAEQAMKAARCGARGEGRRGVLVDLREHAKQLGGPPA